jgi:general secretion pathway protein H
MMSCPTPRAVRWTIPAGQRHPRARPGDLYQQSAATEARVESEDNRKDMRNSAQRPDPGASDPGAQPERLADRQRDRGVPSGFTLIETIVVLVIVGLALTIVAGFLPRRNTTLELTAATARVAGALRLARSRAMVESRPVAFAATLDGHGFRLDNVPVTLGPAVSVVMMEPRILFSADGSASGGSLRVLVDGKQRVIRIDWLTGRVAVAQAL